MVSVSLRPSLPGSSIHGIVQARVWEWVATVFCMGTSCPRDRTWVSQTAGRFFTVWATRAASNPKITYINPSRCCLAANSLLTLRIIYSSHKISRKFFLPLSILCKFVSIICKFVNFLGKYFFSLPVIWKFVSSLNARRIYHYPLGWEFLLC